MSERARTPRSEQDGVKEIATTTEIEYLGEKAQIQHVAGSALLIDRHGSVRKLPIPSSNPNDPLNWKGWEKATVIFCCCWFSFNSLAITSGLGSILEVFFAMYGPAGYGVADISLLLTLPSLCIGLGNFILLPMALAFGRRPVFIASSAILLAALIGAALQSSYSAHLGTRVLAGLATGAAESVLPLILTEITFLADRGKIMGLYWGTQNLLTAVLTITASYEVAALGWRWYYWTFAITIGAGLIFVILGAFETSFQRSLVSIDGQVVVTDQFGITHVVPDDQAQNRLNDTEVDQESDAEVQRASYLQKLKPWPQPRPHPVRLILTTWVQMALSLTSPALLYVILISSAALSGVIFQSLTYATTLISLGWSAKNVGLINVGAIVASVIAMVYCTFLGDPLVLWLARRNQGIHKPEHRLVPMIPVCMLGFAMHLVFGFSSTSTSAWGTIVSYTMSNAAFIAVLIISSTFAAEVTPKHPGPAIVMVIGMKNIISFGVSHKLSATIGVHSLRWSFGVFAGVFGGVALLGVPVYFLNPWWRAFNTKVDEKAGR